MGESERASPDSAAADAEPELPTPELPTPERDDDVALAGDAGDSEPTSPEPDPLEAASDELPRSSDEVEETEAELEPAAPRPKRAARRRDPHQIHTDVAFVRTRILWNMDVSYDLSRPGAVAAGNESMKLNSDGMGFLLSAGWTWRFVGAGGELMHTWGQPQEVTTDTLRQVGVSTRATPHFTSVCVYADLRPIERWFSVRAGVGLGGVALSDSAAELDLDEPFGVVPQISARFSVPVEYGLRVFAGAGARVVLLDGFSSVLDWRLGVELN